jgi:hypothetical protein
MLAKVIACDASVSSAASASDCRAAAQIVTIDGFAAGQLAPTFQLLTESSPLTNEKNFMCCSM